MRKIITILTFIMCVSGIDSQTTYIWTGVVNSNFSTAGNWSPTRQVGLSSDILIFNIGATLNIINVNQVTLGKLIVMNSTQLRLTPSTGNSKVVSIQGVSAGNGPNGEKVEIADVKYREYMNQEPEDLATQKYNEYKITDHEDLATQKYNEYKIPPKSGMGDLKSAYGEHDDIYNNDLSIDSSSSLTIMGNDPRLSIYLKHNATASISGSLIFIGGGDNSINSSDTYAITFKSGSSLVQSCPGNIFTNTGVNNCAVFEDGASLVINHSGALDPFAFVAPASKVSLYAQSNLKINVSNPNVLKVNGRHFPNLLIGNNCNINVIEGITNDFQINDLVINTGGKLYINNISTEVTPNFSIKGNLTINGELHFPVSEGSFISLKVDGSALQSISGSGIIDLNTEVKAFHIYNDIILNRDLMVLCAVSHHNGTINTNGYNFRIYNQYSSREQLPVGVIILSPEKNSEGKVLYAMNTNQLTGKNSIGIPEKFNLSQNYPNPFNPNTKIDFELPKASLVSITVYDITGKEIVTLINGSREAGFNTIDFNGANLASGIYIYRMKAETGNGAAFTKIMKMVLTK